MLMMYLDPVPPYLEKLLSKLEVKPEEKRVSSPYYGYYGGECPLVAACRRLY